MAKRFIDTGLFDDDWFMELSKDCKLLWLYMITKCNPAGFITLNNKLCKFQTGIADIKGALKGLQRGLEQPKKGLYFVHGFLEFQYPGFPNSRVRQQNSAINELKKHGLWDEENKGALKGLQSPYGTVTVTDNGNDIETEGVGDGRGAPDLTEFLDYAKELCVETKKDWDNWEFTFTSKYEAWVENGWKDGNNKKIKNWKTKLRNTLPFLKPVYGAKKTGLTLE